VPRILTIPGLEADGLVHGFSTLELGSVGLTHAPDPDAVNANRRCFAEALDLDSATLTVAGAVHGADVARVALPEASITGVDALVTDRPGIAMFATFADCYPVVLWDPAHRAAGLAHAGWRGTVARVAAATVAVMGDAFGSRPADVVAGIGPGICGRCYEVGADVADRFDGRFLTPRPDGKYLLDLFAALAFQLHEVGVAEVLSLDLCTKETDYLPSHRRQPDGRRFGAIVAVR
jgi:YfiH family protein